VASLDAAKRILKRWPAIGDIVHPGSGVTADVIEMNAVLSQRIP
ncbi:MAG: hypothetical protein JWQ72_3278, partial [Polaromonas sp.]|nr:hypothetical protein [Polaromonas sp.]